MVDVPNITHASLDQFEYLFSELEGSAESEPGLVAYSRLSDPKLLCPTPHLQYLTLTHVHYLDLLVIELLWFNPAIIMLKTLDWDEIPAILHCSELAAGVSIGATACPHKCPPHVGFSTNNASLSEERPMLLPAPRAVDIELIALILARTTVLLALSLRRALVYA